MHEFQKVINELIALFRELISVEDVKLQAASKDRVATVEECMTKEQAAILRLRGLEKEREKAQQEIGFGGLTFKEILDHVSEEEQQGLLPLFNELSGQIQMFQEISGDAAHIMEINLYKIKKTFENKGDNLYSESGSPLSAEHHMTNRRV